MKLRNNTRGKTGKVKFKINDIVNLLVFKNYKELMNKYKLEKDTLTKVEKALRRGSWEIVP